MGAVQAKSLGQVGPVYPIIEKTVTERSAPNHNRQPKKIASVLLPTASADAKHYLDLSYTVPRDITNADGNVIYQKGYRFNPLEHRRFRTMIVINATDDKQLDWVETIAAAADPMTRIVITEGNQAEASTRFKRRVYRLHPQVAKRYHITKVPTIVQQKGDFIEVSEKRID